MKKTVCAFQVEEGQDFWWAGRQCFRAYGEHPDDPWGIRYVDREINNSLNRGKGSFLGWNAKVEVLA